MLIDPETGLLYIPVSSPSPNFYGGKRKEKLPLATSVTALDSGNGKVVWSRQLVHHDIWDYDTNSAPVLIDLKKDGKTIPALVQSSKQGFLYVLNRQRASRSTRLRSRRFRNPTWPEKKHRPPSLMSRRLSDRS